MPNRFPPWVQEFLFCSLEAARRAFPAAKQFGHRLARPLVDFSWLPTVAHTLRPQVSVFIGF
jgi:hypothetical protein